MFQNLKNRWKVNEVKLALIITTFALGGSLCGYVARKIIALTSLDKGLAWVLLYIILLTVLWPIAVILISIPLGQFGFFKNYVGKIGKKIFKPGSKKAGITRVAIFASGAGSNAQQLISYFAGSEKVTIALIVCNNPAAGVLMIAQKANIPYVLVNKERFFNGDAYLAELSEQQIGFIILAGFLWKLPQTLVKAYPKKILNIHPALLPKYGGKGMYGHAVHEAVISNKEKESGISIHYVDELYDHGEVIFQATCTIAEDETAKSLAQKIHVLEHTHYPVVVDKIISGG